MAERTPTPDGLAVTPNAAGDANNPAATGQEMQAHRFWGRWSTALFLPNAASNAATVPAYAKMRPGDRAWVQGTQSIYVLEDRGTDGGADAVWNVSGGGGGADHFTPNVIVGNVPAGDPAAAQAAPFQYIGDPGDGTGIAAALAALPVGGGTVGVRPGTYTAPAAPLTVPAGAKMFGGGVNTVLVAGGTSRQLVRQLAGSVVQGFQLRVNAPPSGAAGTEIVLLDGDAILRDCLIYGGAGAGDPLFAETLTGIVRVSSATPQDGCSFEELIITNVPTGLVGIDLVGDFHVARRIQFRREFATRGAGPGIRMDGDRCEATAVSGVLRKGFEVTGDSCFVEGTVETTGLNDGVDLVAALRCRVNVLATNGSPAAGSVGIRVRAASDRNMVAATSVRDYDTGVDVAATADRNILLGLQIDVTGTPVIDLGTLTETAHIRI